MHDLLVGREAELAILDDIVDRAAGGRGTIVLVNGEPGIGKTRLLEEAASRASARGFAVAWGRAWEVGHAPPYWPWIEILRALFALPGGRDDSVAELLPELSGGRASADGADAFTVCDRIASYLRTAGERAPLLVLLEDLHAADPSSLHVAELAARQIRSARVAIVGSHRDVEARRNPAIDTSLARLGRTAERISVGRLAPADVRTLVVDAIGRDDAEAARMIHDATDGNPLFVRELLRLLTARGSGTPGTPPGVRAVIRERLALLSPATVALLGAAAVVGREFSLAAAAEVAGVTAEALADAGAEARAADLVHDGAAGHLRFSHALVAETLAADLAAPVRTRLHRRAAEALERLHAVDPAAPLDAIAHHWLEAGPDASPRAVDAAMRAAAGAEARLAFADAAAMCERALGALAIASPGDAARRVDILLAMGEAFVRAGDRARGEEACAAAAELGRAAGDGVVVARAALAAGAEARFGASDPALRSRLEEALSLLPPDDHPLRAQVLARLAAARQPDVDLDGPIAMAHEAIAMARRFDDPALLLRVLHMAIGALTDFAPRAERLPLNEEAARLAIAAGDRPRALRALIRLALDYALGGDLTGFGRAVEEYAAIANLTQQPRFLWLVPMLRSMKALWMGRWDEADSLEAEAAAIRERAPDDGIDYGMTRRWARNLLRGERHELTDREIAWMTGGQMEFASLLRAYGDARNGDPVTITVSAPVIALVHGDAQGGAMLGEIAWATSDSELAARVIDALRRHAGHALMVTGIGYAIFDVVDRTLMRMAALCGRWDDAERYATSALALCERLAAAPIEALVRRDHAAVMARRAASAPVAAAAPAPLRLVLEGEFWTVTGLGETCRIRDSRGMRMLATLVGAPGREHHVLDLSGALGAVDGGDSGEVLDTKSRAAYQERVRELREEIQQATEWNDEGKKHRLTEELEALTAEISGAFGLGGRPRVSGAAVERARSNVRRRIADAMQRIADACPALGGHLERCVRTGVYCAYVPAG